MCRFLCYRGPAVALAAMLFEPANSLILQSYKAGEPPELLKDVLGGERYTDRVRVKDETEADEEAA